LARAAYPLAGQRAWGKRRARARALLVSIGATVFVLAFCVSGTVGFLADASLSGIRSTLASVPAGEASVVLRAPLARNADGQDAGVRSVIAAVFDHAPLTVVRTLSPTASDFVRWTITPIAGETTAVDLGKLGRGYSRIEAAITKSRAARSPGVELSGRGTAIVSTLSRAVGAEQTIEPIPLTALGLAGIVAVLLARSLLTDSRANETRLLRSRGGSGHTITALDARESIVVCVVGTIAGSLLAEAILVGLYRVVPDPIDIVLPLLAVLVVGAGIVVTVAGLAARAASGSPRSESGRRRAAAPLTLTGFGILIAAIAFWRFEQSGTDGAAFDADPSAVLAPAALLCAAVLLCLLAAGRVTAWAESALRRRRSVAVLPVRSVNRHIAIVAGPTALLGIAVALATITSAYSGTWQRFATDSAQLTTGGDLRAVAPVEPLLVDASDVIRLGRYSSVPGIEHAALAARQSDTFGDLPVTVVAVRSADLPRLIRAGSTVSNPEQLARALDSATQPGLALPAHASAVTLRILATGAATEPTADSVQTTVWLGDARGDLFPLSLHSALLAAPAHTGTAVTGALPASGGPWFIRAIDANISAPDAISRFRFRITSVTARVGGRQRSVAIPSSSRWTPRDGVFENGTNRSAQAGTIGFDRPAFVASDTGPAGVRIMPAGTARVGVVLSQPFAEATGLVTGSTLSVDGQWASFNGVVAGVVANVPGAASGDSMIANLPALENAWLQTSEQIPSPNEVWMSSASPNSTANRLRAAIPGTQVRLAGAAGGSDIVRSASIALWVGTLGTSTFAIIALAAALTALLRRRAVETRALRALGLSAVRQASLRRREVGILSAVAVATGAITGAGVALLVTATMARLSTPDAPAALPLSFEVDPLPLAATVLTLVVAVVLCVVVYGGAVRRQAGGQR
jgi:hypothetical protein